jgi:hypothetical protein
VRLAKPTISLPRKELGRPKFTTVKDYLNPNPPQRVGLKVEKFSPALLVAKQDIWQKIAGVQRKNK